MEARAVGPYRLVKTLAESPFGATHVAREPRRGGPTVALKVLRPGFAVPGFQEFLAAEHRALAALADPGLPAYLDAGPAGQDGFYYASALMAGPDIVEATAEASVEEACGLVLDAAATLDRLHRQGFLHLDIRPRNILVVPGGRSRGRRVTPRTRLVDLRLGGPSLAGAGKFPGAAPELLAGGPVGPRSDVYGLGAVLFEVLARRTPSGVEHGATWVFAPERPERADAAILEAVCDLVRCMLAPDPASRPPDMPAVIRVLGGAWPGLLSAPVAPAAPASPDDLLLGREAEVRRVEGLVGAALRGAAPRPLIIRGPRGFGKSRLLREAGAIGRARGMRVAGGSGGSAFEEGRALQAIGASTGGTGVPNARPVGPLEAARRVVEAARLAPTAVLLDDVLPGCRPLTLFLAELSRLADACRARATPLRLAVVATCGAPPDEVLELPEGATEEIDLAPLGVAAAERLVRAMAPVEDGSETLARRIHAAAGGAPQDLARAVSSLHDRGILVATPDGWSVEWKDLARLDPELVGSPTPGPAERDGEADVLKLLARAGGPLPLEVVAAAAGRSIEEVLASTRRGRLEGRVSLGLDAMGVRFREGPLAATDAGDADRTAACGRLAAAWEQLPEERRDPAVHIRLLLGAGDVRRALEVGLAEAARRLEAEPLIAFQVAEIVLAAAPGDDDPRAAARLLTGMAAVHARLGHPAEAAGLLSRAIERTTGDDPDRAERLTRLGVALYQAGEAEEGRRRIEEALAIHRGRRNLDGEAQCRNMLGNILSGSDPDAALAEYEGALAAAQNTPNPLLQAGPLNNIGLLERQRGKAHAARRRFVEALRAYRRAHHDDGVAICLTNLAILALDAQRTARAIRTFRHVLELDRRAGSLPRVASSLGNLGAALFAAGRDEDAAHQYGEAERASESLYDAGAVASHQLDRATCLLRLGRFDEAEALIRGSLEVRKAGDDPEGEAACLRGLATVRQHRGELGEAVRLARESLERRRSVGDPDRIAASAIALAEILLDARAVDAARPAIEEARAAFARMDAPDPALVATTLLLEARACRLAGDPAAGLRPLEKAEEMARRLPDPRHLAAVRIEAGASALARGCGTSDDPFADAIRRLGETADPVLRAEGALGLARARAAVDPEGAAAALGAFDAEVAKVRGADLPRLRLDVLLLRASLALEGGGVAAIRRAVAGARRLFERLAGSLPGDLSAAFRSSGGGGALDELEARARKAVLAAAPARPLHPAHPLAARVADGVRIAQRARCGESLRDILAWALSNTRADRGTLLVEGDGIDVSPACAGGFLDRAGRAVPVGPEDRPVIEAVASVALHLGEPVLYEDAARLLAAATGAHRSALAVPIRGPEGPGEVLYLEGPSGALSADDLEALRLVAEGSAVAAPEAVATPAASAPPAGEVAAGPGSGGDGAPPLDRGTLLAVCHRMAGEDPGDEAALATALDLVRRASGADRAACLAGEDGRRVLVSSSDPAVGPEEGRSSLETSVARRAARTGERQVLTVGGGAGGRLFRTRGAAARGVRSVVAIPFRADGWVLYLDARRERAFDEGCVSFVAEFGRTVLAAILRRRAVAQPTDEPGGPRTKYHRLVGRSEAMQALYRLMDRLAGAECPVLIQGESGTGKELVARAIHAMSPRRSKPFVAENCAAVPEGLIEAELFGHAAGAFTGASGERKGLMELADGGTFFLDEVGDMSPLMQQKLLRVLEEGEIRPVGRPDTRKVDVRIVAATNRPLRDLVRTGRFREDLYYRLSVFPLGIPPLRDRRDDVPLLIDTFLQEIHSEGGAVPDAVAPDARRLLAGYDWPGNVRELRAFVQRAVLATRGGAITADVVLEEIPGLAQKSVEGIRYAEMRAAAIDRFEREYVVALLERCGGNVSRAAREAGIKRQYLQRLLRKHGIERKG